jgi:hypothetical protein
MRRVTPPGDIPLTIRHDLGYREMLLRAGKVTLKFLALLADGLLLQNAGHWFWGLETVSRYTSVARTACTKQLEAIIRRIVMLSGSLHRRYPQHCTSAVIIFNSFFTRRG